MEILVVGLGLIGGSMAKAVKRHTDHTVTGMDLTPAIVKAALDSGAIDKAADDASLSRADLTLLGLYPVAAGKFIQSNAKAFKPGSLIVDLCGVKRHICAQAEQVLDGTGVHFIGGHPMAGKAAFGFENADSDLFCGAPMILCPAANMPASITKKAEDFFLSLGFGTITLTTPEHHDEMIGLTSQLAHVVSSAYVQDPDAQRHAGFSAGSFKDMTRVAKLNEEMWSELFLCNADVLSLKISCLINKLTEIRTAIDAGDKQDLFNLLKSGREIKERLLALDSSNFEE